MVYLYCTIYQSVDEEEFGGLWELLKEGFFTSFAMFLVNYDTLSVTLSRLMSNLNFRLYGLLSTQHCILTDMADMTVRKM